jgi:hypothetical protein
MLGNAPKSSWKPFEQYHLSIKRVLVIFGKGPKNIGAFYGNAYKVADTLWEMPK